MRQTSILALGLAAAALGSPAFGAPLSAYGALPTIAQVAISPNGQLLAVDVVKGDQRTLVVQDLTAKKIVTGVKLGDAKVRYLQWAGNDHLIITSSTTSNVEGSSANTVNEWYFATDFNLTKNRLRPLLGDVDNSANMLYRSPTVRRVGGKSVLFLQGIRFSPGGVGQSTLFRINLDDDQSTPVVDTVGEIGVDYALAADGTPLAMSQYDAPTQSWTLSVWVGTGWRKAEAQKVSVDAPRLLGLGRDGRSILIGSNEDDRHTLRELAADGSKLSDPLPGDTDGEVLSDPVGHQMIGMEVLDGDDRQYQFIDPGDEARWRAVQAAFAGKSVAICCWSDDRRKMVVRVTAPEEAPSYALVDLDAGATAFLGSEYPDLGPGDVSPVEPISYKAADGLPLSGYLTLPHGKDPKKLPLIVFPHGSLESRDYAEFDWFAQAMASRGYAVLQVNYRGSGGYGLKFTAEGFGELGRKMQTDLSDGVRYLAAKGTIDPARVCIVGGQDAGYAALAGATLDVGVYRCAVDLAGPSELTKLIDWAKARIDYRAGGTSERYWTRLAGAQSLSDPRLEAISPADHADKAAIPVLLIHGKDDMVVPFEQSQIMADALRKAGKPYDFVVLSHEDHWLSRSDTRLQMLQATMDFLEKNNPPS